MSSHILQVTCLTENFPEGQKITGARLRYDRPIDGAWITPAAYFVKGRTVTGIAVAGDTVTLSLNTAERGAYVVPLPGRKPEGPDTRKPGGPVGPGKPGPGGPHNMPAVVRGPREVSVAQISDVRAQDGTILPPWEDYVVSDSVVEPVIEDFVQDSYQGIPYNLYIPKQQTGPLPLVLFIHDAGPCGPDVGTTLAQGSGAISFASPEWQAEHPCFVLAPQIDRTVHLTSDSSEASDELEIIKSMVDDVARRYAVDQNRIYATGQSMGCMASCELNIRYPDYFAASLLVAGQWSPERMAEKCQDCKLWILVSEHDARAFPGMNAVTEAMEAGGCKFGRYWWDAKLGAEKLSELAREAMKDDVDKRYTVFCGSSVVPADRNDDPGNNHTSTWNVVYPIRGVREWLFSCSKN